MKLPHLTQLVLLDRHMPRVVHHYLGMEQRALLKRDPTQGQRLSTVDALALAPIQRLLQRLATLQLRDEWPAPKKPRPHRLKVDYAEMTAVRFYYARMLASAACHPDSHCLLATALGRFHQPSLNLESHVRLASPTFYGPQLELL